MKFWRGCKPFWTNRAEVVMLDAKTFQPAVARLVAAAIDPSTPERVLFTWPHFMSRRVVAQQGHFSVSTKILCTHDHFILEACSNVAEDREEHIVQRKVVIAADLKLVILQQLRAMNIAPHALFPSLDGLGKSLSDLARLRAALVGGTG